uniref:RNase H type-1 domain-containing protein n=1 Tax=Oryza brachyantha TaxID=4533 RepID=J3LWF0_ORYBR
MAFDLWHMQHPKKKREVKQFPGWQRPRNGWHKCNTNGAYYEFYEFDRARATGCVIRDQDSWFMARRVAWHNNTSGVLVTEAEACKSGLILAQHLGVTKLCLESDCLDHINLWNKLDDQRLIVNLILQDIQALSGNFDDFTFVYISRLGNKQHLRDVAYSSLAQLDQVPGQAQAYILKSESLKFMEKPKKA